MPGFFITNSKNSPKLRNYDDTRCVSGEMSIDEWSIKWNHLNKFMDDRLFTQNEEYVIILDGVILNKKDLMHNKKCESWQDTVYILMKESDTFFSEFRGAFSGAIYDKKNKKWTFFTDQTNNHILFIYHDDNYIAVGSQLNYISDWMKCNGIERTISDYWINDFLAYGYMLDTHSIIDGVNRLFPGDYAVYEHNTLKKYSYYVIEKHILNFTESEWIEKLDYSFYVAVKRMVDKCREYNYKAVVDVSGGLDSRMIIAQLDKCVSNVSESHIGINYSQLGSLDDRIAHEVADSMQMDMISYAMDGGECLKEIDDFVFMTNGLNYYAGITGGKKMLEMLDRDVYGMEYWGVLGDIYEGAMIVEKDISISDWNYPRFKTSSRFDNINTNGYRKYEDNELLWFYVRGVLCGEATSFIRQNFVEAPVPYGDVDFMNLIFSIPYELRTEGHLYRKWMVRKYPRLSKIIYSHTGVRVTETDWEENKLRFPIRVKNKIENLFFSRDKIEKKQSMNPIDYWLKSNASLREYFDNYYSENLYMVQDKELRNKVKILFSSDDSTGMEKIMALTILSAIKQFIL